MLLMVSWVLCGCTFLNGQERGIETPGPEGAPSGQESTDGGAPAPGRDAGAAVPGTPASVVLRLPDGPVRVDVEGLEILRPREESRWVPDLSAIIAAVAAVLTAATAWQFAKRSRVDTFRQLRERFYHLRTDKTHGLPENWWKLDLSKEIDPGDFERLQRYWLNAFDEWYITQKSAPFSYKTLWTDYYEAVLRNSAQRPLMLMALLVAFKGSGTTPLDQKFLDQMCALAGPNCQAVRSTLEKLEKDERAPNHYIAKLVEIPDAVSGRFRAG
jgi:hypothetical protein